MILRMTVKTIRLTLSVTKIAKIIGVNSKLDCETCRIGNVTDVINGCKRNCHILMWDFDKTDLETIKRELSIVQLRYLLSDIHILETNHREGNFIAYCFTRTNWHHAIGIVSETQGIDWNFVRLSVYRGWFTLRVGAKKSGIPHLVSRLSSCRKPDCSPSDMRSWVKYETLDRD